MRYDLWDFVEKSQRILEQIHVLVRSFEDGVCSKRANIEKEATDFKAFRCEEEKKKKKIGYEKYTKIFHILSGKCLNWQSKVKLAAAT